MTDESVGSGVEDVLITAELERRPSRPPDHEAEGKALAALAETLAQRPQDVLQSLTNLMVELGLGDSAGISILEGEGAERIFRWPALSGQWSRFRGGTMPFSAGPCGVVVTRDQVLLFEHPERVFPEANVDPLIKESLLMPFHVNGKAVGTVWANTHSDLRKFDREDVRLLTGLARFAAAGHQMNEALAAATTGEEATQGKYRALFDTMDQGFCVIEKLETGPGRKSDFRYVVANPAFERHTGLRDVAGKTILELVPDAEDRILDIYDEVVRTGRPAHFEDHVAALDLWMEAQAMPAEQPDRIAILFSNVTARKKAELALRESEERFRALVTTGSYSVYRMSPDWRHMYELQGRDFLTDTAEPVENWEERYILADDRPMVRAAIEEAIGSRSMFDLEHRVRRADGSAGWTHSRAVPMLGGDGEIIEWFGAASDVTARRRAQEELRESEEKYRTLFETMGQGYAECEMVRDAEGRALDVRYIELNPSWERLTGLPVADVRGRTAREVVPGLEDWWIEMYDRVVTSGTPERIEHEAAPLGRYFEVQVYPGSGDRFSVLYDDITERKRAETARRESEERQAFLLKFSDALRPLTDAMKIQSAAVELVGRHLRASRTIYALVYGEPGAEQLHLTGQYVTVGEPMPEWVDAQAFGSALVDAMLRGEWIGVTDAATDPRIPDADRAAHLSAKIASYGCVSLMKQGRAVAVLSVHSDVPREWTASEAALLSEVADRMWDAVERARAEAALRENQHVQSAMLEVLPLGIAMVAKDRSVILSNPRWSAFAPTGRVPSGDSERLWRWQAWDEQGKPVEPEDFPTARALRGEHVLPGLEFLYTDDTGREIWTNVASVPVRNEQGQVVSAVSIIADIDAAKRANDALRESEERFRLIVENATDYAIFIADPDDIITDWLPGAEAVFGWTAEEAIGRPGGIIFTPDDQAQGEPAQELETARREGVAPNVRWHQRKDGSLVFIDGMVTPLRNEDGSIRGYLKIGQDVSERRSVQEALEASERRMRSLVTGIPQMVFRSQGDGHRIWGSPQWIDYTGLSFEESLGLGWLEAAHPQERDATLAAWEGVEERGEYYCEHRVLKAATGEYRWHQTRAAPLKDEEGRILEWLGTSTDVEELRQLQRHQQVLLGELQHRVRNTLAIVRSIARRTAQTSESVDDMASHFSGRLDAFSRVQSAATRNPMGAVALTSMIEDELLAHAAREGEALIIRGPEVHLKPRAAESLSLAIHELTSNAVKYGALSADHGRLSVQWERERSDGGEWLALAWEEQGVDDAPSEPERQGFGMELLQRTLPYDLGAETDVEFRPQGLRFTLRMPLGEKALAE